MHTETIHISEERINITELQRCHVYVAIFGHGKVGEAFLEQLFARQQQLIENKNLEITVFALANSSQVLFKKDGIDSNWQQEKIKKGVSYSVHDVIDFATQNKFENLIAIDNTADNAFTQNYEALVANGFHLVSSNKHKNTNSWEEYLKLRSLLKTYEKNYLYETNVGAGLPLIDTINLLHQSGENITRIRGVFSGSLSFIFNEFSEGSCTFSEMVKKAKRKGFTEPDPREDLCGMDVARKLLILARELELRVELKDVSIQNLIPKQLRNVTEEAFFQNIKQLDLPFLLKKKNLKKDSVLRYVGDLHGDLSREDGGVLEVRLQETPKNSMLGQLKGSDSLFEIYTESYGSNPIVIQGAGAGAAVTARGVFGDVLRICNQL
ncbi:aspartate kinase [Rasiella rasia]|uniref:Homoserine dehydrogenase n=1 Tax=Rasiella rasia TaxID=2744027 RepID=A0A6G6GL56_9FLAO|nr:aspartate kinase [Rasiella rasia]QIE59254.1 aspartate kinase [Rasiella rasia]